jgi:hypothetical protein
MKPRSELGAVLIWTSAIAGGPGNKLGMRAYVRTPFSKVEVISLHISGTSPVGPQ